MQLDLILIPETELPLLSRFDGHEPLRGELERAIVVSDEAMPSDVVTMYSRVVYVDERTGAEREVVLVYPSQADAAAGRVSVLAPVGTALLGLSAGQSIEWPFPDGSVRRLHVKAVVQPGADVSRDSL
ncbi:MAG TPA: nucleoside diphosphate kinase regulator [Burkholderiales bacterium]|nr:nucleoside diphosphate kinase regulator [Burkholderiales bacterium]